MRRRAGQATKRESKFAQVLAATGNVVAAAHVAGYGGAATAGYEVAQRPIVREMTRQALEEFVRDRAGQIGISVLVELAESESTPASTRRAAAKDLTELSGVGRNVSGSKDLADMTGDELQAAITMAKARAITAEHLAAERAQPVIDGAAVVVDHVADLYD